MNLIRRLCTGLRCELAWPESVACLAFLPDGKSLVVGYEDGAIWLYRLGTGERVRSFCAGPLLQSALFKRVFGRR